MADRPLLRVVESGPVEAVSTRELRRRLAEFQEAYRQCDMIDCWADVLKCRRMNQQYIDKLKAEIALREADEEDRDRGFVPLWLGMGGESD